MKKLPVLLTDIAQYMHVSVRDIRGKSKRQPLPDARHLFVYVAKQYKISGVMATTYINKAHSLTKHVRFKSQNDYEFMALIKEFQCNK